MVKNLRTSNKIGVSSVLAFLAATSAFAVTAPDLPMTGWATQNGGTTGGAGKTVVTVSNVSDLRKYAEAGNYTIYVKPGTYKVASKDAIEVGDNVTIYGYQGAIMEQTYTGTTKEDNTVMNITGKNIIIRNLIFKGAGAIDKDAGDCLHVQGGTNVWLDHLDVYDGEDGNLDVINGANYVTISWTKFSYTSASSDHQFSNLIGNSDNKTSDSGKLKTTLHHNWWADGVKERMPRVRFGQVHVANNLFDSDKSSTCVRAAIKADLRVEGNVFIGVNKPIDLYDGDYTAVLSSGNYTEGTSGNSGSGKNSSAFSPSYTMGITDVSTKEKAYVLRDSIMNYAGATLPNPGESGTVTNISSSSAVVTTSSSSVANSSSSSVKATESSSSASTNGTATLTKHGVGSAKQTVAQGESIQEFYFTIAGATGATVTGLPEGITGTLNGSDFYISGTVSTSAAAGEYAFTVTTTGASTNASKSGVITVTAAGNATSSTATASSSSSITAASSSSSAIITSSSSESGSVVAPESSSSEAAASSSSEKDTIVEPSSSSDKAIESSDAGTIATPESSSATGSDALTIQQQSQFKMQVFGRSLTIQNARIGSSVTVFDMQGRLITQKRISSNDFSLMLSRTGSYLVRINNQNLVVNIH